MNRDRPVYIYEHNYGNYTSGNNKTIYWQSLNYNDGWSYLMLSVPAGTSGVVAFPYPFAKPPYIVTGFRSIRADKSYDRELCCFNATSTSVEFNNFGVPTYGGQTGNVFMFGNRG